MRPALSISTRRAKSSCLINYCCIEKRMLLSATRNVPFNRPPLICNQSFSTLVLNQKKKFNHRLLSKEFDIQHLLDHIATNSLSSKETFKFLRAALYNIGQLDVDNAWLIYQSMVDYQVDKYLKPNNYGCLLSILKNGNHIPQMLTVLENMKSANDQPTCYHISQVLYAMSRQGLVKECVRLLQHQIPTTNHYHSLAIALRNSSRKDPKLVEQVTELMLEGVQQHSTLLDQSTISIMLSLLASRQHQNESLILKFLKAMDTVSKISHHETYNVYVYTSLIAGFARQGDSISAKKLFDEMQKHNVQPNQVTFAAMMEAYGRAGDFDAAHHLLKEHQSRYKKLSNPLVTSLLVNAIRHHNFPVAKKTARLIKREIRPEDQDTMLRTALLWLKAKQNIDDARNEFDRLYQQDKNLVHHIMVNHLIEGFGKKQDKSNVLKSYDLSKKLGIVQQEESRTEHYVANALFHCRDVSAALSIFGTMRTEKVPDEITIAMVIQGLVMNNEGNLAWRLFKTLQGEKIEPNLHAYTSMLKAFGHRDADLKKKDQEIPVHLLEAAGIRARVDYLQSPIPVTTEALGLFRRMTGFHQPNVYTYTTLISCFAKNNITQAIRIFDHMCSHNIKPTVETYTALLQGCAIFRNSQMALTIFNHMCEQKVEPNAVTWRYLLKSLLRARVDKNQVDKFGKMARESLKKSK